MRGRGRKRYVIRMAEIIQHPSSDNNLVAIKSFPLVLLASPIAKLRIRLDLLAEQGLVTSTDSI